MKKLILFMMFSLFILSSCGSPKAEGLILGIQPDREKEALEMAYRDGMTMGYTVNRIDREELLVEFIKKNEYSDITIRMAPVEQEEDYEGPLEFEITTKIFTREISDKFQVEADVKKLAEAINRCCGIHVKDESGDEIDPEELKPDWER
jgi:hypothetical protein